MGIIKSLIKPPKELQRGYKKATHLGKVAEFSCRACRIEKAPRQYRLHVHHKCGIGAGKKASDLLTFTLCEFHHQSGGIGHAIHDGLAQWEEKFGKQDDLILEIHAELGITTFKDYLELIKD